MNTFKRNLTVSAPDELILPMNVPAKLLMGPGPANVSPRVLAAGALPVLGHMHPEMLKIMDDIKVGLQYAFQTKNSLTFAVSGTGHCGMEVAMMNVIDPGDVILVACNGIWGERQADLGKRIGAEVRVLQNPTGVSFSLSQIEESLKSHRPNVFIMTQGESSSGVLQPMEGIGQLCRRYNSLLLVDTVASLGGVPMYTDEWGIDVIYSGSQKVLGAPPGTAPISFNQKAWEKYSRKKTRVPSFYLDLSHLANYWGCDDSPRRYHHTCPVNSLYQLREGLAILAEEGIESFWARHLAAAKSLYAGLNKLGLKLFVENEASRLPTVSAVMVPPGVDWKKLVSFVMQKYKIEISGGLGPSAGKVWRIGLMGYNANQENVKRVLRALEDGLNHCRTTSRL
ncbi:alanine--glyoxylate aminotransferase-like [Diadema antillarum]|uniref:alanine--glyoxylate aminotransferase-like n=1 Tax=Diadema antillarum TaxID=105358 RepID=UPI003A873409